MGKGTFVALQLVFKTRLGPLLTAMSCAMIAVQQNFSQQSHLGQSTNLQLENGLFRSTGARRWR